MYLVQFIRGFCMALADSVPVSYTHLDVYKRQIYDRAKRERLGYLAIGASTEKYIQLLSLIHILSDHGDAV